MEGRMARRVFGALFAYALWSSAAQAQDVKAEINILNNRDEPVVMRFDYAFRDYTWNLIEHSIDARDEITYRYPSNIPGCERLREWRITDGLLTISNAMGPLCKKRVSLCDKRLTVMAVGNTACDWTVK
jgi:hypothetical protein